MNIYEQQYLKGFNHGYLLTKHLPELVTKMTKQIQATTNDYLAGFFSGKEEYELEYSREQAGQLNEIRNASKNRGREMEQ